VGARLRSHARPRGTCRGPSVTGTSSSVRMYVLTNAPYSVLRSSPSLNDASKWHRRETSHLKCLNVRTSRCIRNCVCLSVLWLYYKQLTSHAYLLTQVANSLVGTATQYGMDGAGFESRWGGEIFRIRPHRPWGPPSLLYKVSFPRARRPGRGVDHPPPSSAKVKEGVKLYLYSPCALAARYRENFPFPCTRIHYRTLRKACGNRKVNLLQTSQHYTDIRMHSAVCEGGSRRVWPSFFSRGHPVVFKYNIKTK
jgi:hypothetical protein